MTLAEDGADYIAFGIPPHVEDRAAAAARQLELVAWWGEIFEIPCVAFDIDTCEEAIALAGAGADFVAVRADALQAPDAARGLALAATEAAQKREAMA
jgi:thiamine-phosphate pyrophosphorylase